MLFYEHIITDKFSLKTYIISVVDASSKYSGVLYGKRFDYGNYDQCLEIDRLYEHGRLMGKYCPLSLLIPDSQTGFTEFEVSKLLSSYMQDIVFKGKLNKSVKYYI